MKIGIEIFQSVSKKFSMLRKSYDEKIGRRTIPGQTDQMDSYLKRASKPLFNIESAEINVSAQSTFTIGGLSSFGYGLVAICAVIIVAIIVILILSKTVRSCCMKSISCLKKRSQRTRSRRRRPSSKSNRNEKVFVNEDV